jgi:hypothetical protein
MVTDAGSGYSHWRDLAITRWREDVTRDVGGTYIFLRDADSGVCWSAGYQPLGGKPDSYAVSFTEDRAEIVRRDGSKVSRLEVIVSPEDDAEVRRVSRLYGGALDVIEHLRAWGPTVILSDGDVVFQPRKTQRSGLWEAVEGRVLIYLHKELMLDDVESRYPARRYVMVDDKLRILAAMKKTWGERLTTVFPRQGHYAFDSENIAKYPSADLTLEHIGDLVNCDLPTLLGVPEVVRGEREQR